MALGAHRTWRVSLIFFVLVGCSASERQSNTSTECPEGTSVSGAAPPRGRGYHCQKQVNGQWVRHGPAAVWTDKGKIWQGTFRDGRMEGPWTFNTFEGRKIADIEFTDGVPSIADRPKCRQGNKADTDFIWFGGSPPPDEFFQFRVGCIAERADALDTPVEGPYVAWMIRGEKVEVGEIRDGKNHGAIEAWYRNGKPSMRGQHENGTQVGEWTWWHETGGRRLAGMYVDGKRHGEWTIWHQDGSSKIEKYALGTLIPEPSQQVAAKVGEKQCLQLGGTWGGFGMMLTPECNLPTKDAGKPCTDHGQCQSLCVSDKRVDEFHKSGACSGPKPIAGKVCQSTRDCDGHVCSIVFAKIRGAGQCFSWTITRGHCLSHVVDGQISAPLCAD